MEYRQDYALLRYIKYCIDLNIMPIKEKKCRECGEIKSYKYYSKDKRNFKAGGLRNECKECHSEYNRKRYKEGKLAAKSGLSNGLFVPATTSNIIDISQLPEIKENSEIIARLDLIEKMLNNLLSLFNLKVS